MTGEGGADGDGLASHPLDGHQLLVAEPTRQWAGVGAWLLRGLARGETVIYAADAATGTVGELEQTLARHGVDATQAVADGRLAVSEPDRYFSLHGHLKLVEKTLDEGRGVRTCNRGEPLTRMSPTEQAEFELMLDELWRTRGVSSLCVHGPYLTADPERLDGAVRVHGTGWADRYLHAHASHVGALVLTGEVDFSNVEMLPAIVHGAVRRRGDDELVVDCAALTHMSVGAWRALHDATAGLRDRGVRVRLQVRPTAARVLRITGYDESFALELAP